MFSKIRNFCEKNPSKYVAFTSLGQLKYLSCLKYIDGVVGNSSSGLLEVPSFKIGTVNIGDRQEGRICAESVINCKPTKKSIEDAIKYLFSNEFKKILLNVRNPYGEGGASKNIVTTLENISLKNIINKKFFDLNLP